MHVIVAFRFGLNVSSNNKTHIIMKAIMIIAMIMMIAMTMMIAVVIVTTIVIPIASTSSNGDSSRISNGDSNSNISCLVTPQASANKRI